MMNILFIYIHSTYVHLAMATHTTFILASPKSFYFAFNIYTLFYIKLVPNVSFSLTHDTTKQTIRYLTHIAVRIVANTTTRAGKHKRPGGSD